MRKYKQAKVIYENRPIQVIKYISIRPYGFAIADNTQLNRKQRKIYHGAVLDTHTNLTKGQIIILADNLAKELKAAA